MKYKFLFLIGVSFFIFLCADGQLIDVPKMIDNSLQGVVTVAVFKTSNMKHQMGFRGNSTDVAYAHTLDLTGAETSGSGFVISYEGKSYIVTNAHVVEKASEEQGSIHVYTIGNKTYEAEVVGGDSFYDLALLAFVQPPGSEILPLHFRESDIMVGEPVYAIGNPLGTYPYTVTNGIISAKNRIRGGLTGKFGYLQSTAVTTWGNSGGPLIDVNGFVIGINSQIAFAPRGSSQIWQPQLNFALEAKIALRLVEDIVDNKGLIRRAFLGIVVKQTQSNEQAKAFFPQDKNNNTETDKPIIEDVIAGTPADGMLNSKIGYTILKINGEPTRNVEEVLGCLEKALPGSKITFTLGKYSGVSDVSINSSTLTVINSARFADFFSSRWGAVTSSQQRQLNMLFNKPEAYLNALGNTADGITVVGKDKSLSKEVLFDNEWVVVAAGIVAEEGSTVWQVKDAADLGSALRLTAMTGIIDLILYRKGTDSEIEGNLIKKRFILSGNPQLVEQILFY